MTTTRDIDLAKLVKEDVLRRVLPKTPNLVEVVESDSCTDACCVEIHLLGNLVDFRSGEREEVMKWAQEEAATLVADALIKLERMGWRPPA